MYFRLDGGGSGQRTWRIRKRNRHGEKNWETGINTGWIIGNIPLAEIGNLWLREWQAA